MSSRRPSARRRRGRWLLLLVVAAAAAFAWSRHVTVRIRPPVYPAHAFFEVRRGDLLVSVTEEGALRALNETVVRNSLEGLNRIIRLVPEGVHVTKGELLVELDSAGLRDRLNELELSYQERLFQLRQAEGNLRIQKSLAESQIKDAELKLENAQADLEKYRDGDAPLLIRTIESRSAVLREQVRIARERLARTEDLFKAGNASRSELEADSLSLKREQLGLGQYDEDLRLIRKFDQPNQLRQLEASVQQARQELERVKQLSSNEVAQADADVRTSERTVDSLEEAIDLQKTRLASTKIFAPQDGLVVYAAVSSFFGQDSGQDRPRTEGRFRGGRGPGGGGGGGGDGEFRGGRRGRSGGGGAGTGDGRTTGSPTVGGSSTMNAASGQAGTASAGATGAAAGQRAGTQTGAGAGSGGSAGLGSAGGAVGSGGLGDGAARSGASFASYPSMRASSIRAAGTAGAAGAAGGGGASGASVSGAGSAATGAGGLSPGGSSAAMLLAQFAQRSSSAAFSGGFEYYGGGPTVLEEGMMVRQRQELIRLPDVSRMIAEVRVHESRVREIRPGLLAYVRVENIPDRRFRATVRRVAPLPDSQMSWLNPNLKVYPTDLLIEDPLPELKPGVSARAEIVITNRADVLSVPIQAITRLAGEHVCYVQRGDKVVPVSVTPGWFNDRFQEVTAGLREGDRVLLAPPEDLMPDADFGSEPPPAPEAAGAKMAEPKPEPGTSPSPAPGIGEPPGPPGTADPSAPNARPPRRQRPEGEGLQPPGEGGPRPDRPRGERRRRNVQEPAE